MVIDINLVIEIAAVILGILSVYLTTKQNIWCWPTGLAMVVLYVYVFFNAKLYSDMSENIIYIFMQVYGWYFWIKAGKVKKEDKQAPIRRIKVKDGAIWSAVIIVGTMVVGYFMATYTDAALPYIDAFTTVMSLVAQWLLGRKILENWALWIGVDVIALFVYSIKGLYFTTGLYAVFLGLAISGLLKWYKAYKKQKNLENDGQGKNKSKGNARRWLLWKVKSKQPA